ncbi:amino acid adenylation domain-containing protein [Corallococcus sp. BB11-1]|uniref:non-ribosomal peptide synthetase n=1 Tax=Corallococcus sp. BB11-1 TaxID=2996783 RepID=UPI00226DE2F6|nr:non-ribosomal peptide synthetase [Corallococcus sp. BB11-1]MCY1033270.1 amino acid adenylation domain-containing protein [Corallococcus sp. BB11-1]
MTKSRPPDGCSIVGLATRFADGASSGEFWEALKAKRSLIGRMSEQRRALVDAGTGTHWGPADAVRGAFLADIDCFDAPLFGLAPAAAMFADPRQRLLLESAWAAMEDAGLSRSALAGRKVAVFVAHDGWYLGSYVKRIPAGMMRSQEFIVPGNAPSFLANRLSALFDLHGPSMVFDATCSGTYVALHHACQALESGACDYALVAAVTLFLDPWRDGETSATPFESPLGEVASFSREAKGYRTSEGCGAFLLQRDTPEAQRRHSAYGVIRASGYNSGGRTASFAQPSRDRVAGLFRDVLDAAGLEPRRIDYVEAHGVGALMADAIEANALIDVFQRGPEERPCQVSTVKPNLGHGHASSGVYALLKALKCLEHGQIPAIAGLEPGALNEGIPADTKGLAFLTETVDWPRVEGEPRRVFLSSYGMSNVNAALVLEEPSREPSWTPRAVPGRAVVCLSARSPEQVLTQRQRLAEWLQARAPDADAQSTLDALSYTLRVGREPMRHRWAAVVESLAELVDVLAGGSRMGPSGTARVFEGEAPGGGAAADGEAALDPEDLEGLAAKWVLGASIPWESLHADPAPPRLHLPTYPFARNRCWIPEVPGPRAPDTEHPLLRQDVSTPEQPCFRSDLSGEEFFLADHVIQGMRILPGVAHLEMARAALTVAAGGAVGDARPALFEHVVWARPLTVPQGGRCVQVRLTPSGARGMRFEIDSRPADATGATVLHSQGEATLGDRGAPPRLDLAALRARMHEPLLDAAEVYAIPPHLGLELGPRLRGARHVHVGQGELLGRLVLPPQAPTGAPFVLHPSVMDPILQLAFLALTGRQGERMPLTIPFELRRMELFAGSPPSGWVWIRYAAGSQPGDAVERLDMDLCDDEGQLAVRMEGFAFRTLTQLGRFRSDTMETSNRGEPIRAAPQGPRASTVDFLRARIAAALHLAPEALGARDSLAELGLDSLVAVRLTQELEALLGALPRTLFFEFRDVAALAHHLESTHAEALRSLLGAPAASTAAPVSPLVAPRRTAPGATPTGAADIAIIGLSGRYPGARDLAAFWDNLRAGRDCVTEVPASRWDWRDYFTEDRTQAGHHYSKWGGFLEGVDEFDPLLFGIPPKEAALLDPQERLFLQCVWAALEDAGYCRQGLRKDGDPGRRVGVYAGVMYGEYQLFGVEESLRGNRMGFASTLASIANRVSYVLDLHGPSMTLDTMCSSSLTAITLACQDLLLGNTRMGIAGGVNLSLHPSKYLELSRRQFVSGSGHCASFGSQGDGYVPGEGVGVVVLKRLEDALRDRDAIHGVIKASAINHGGKTSGYTVPDPNAQADVILRALEQSRLDVRAIGYVEAHGTGTRLGDPIEIAGLSRAFAAHAKGTPPDTQACAIGSVKSNVGHCESAAGIAGLTKVLLQMKHGQLVPSLHSETLNPNIDFAATPFRVNREVRSWPRPSWGGAEGDVAERARAAGVSSFGAGGANAHLLVEEHLDAWEEPAGSTDAPVLVPLSARDPERLRQVVSLLLDFVREHTADPSRSVSPGPQLRDVAYTLQVGREPLEERLAVLARSWAELETRLRAFLDSDGGTGVEGCHAGQARGARDLAAAMTEGDLEVLVRSWMERGELERLASQWVRGLPLDWEQLHGGQKPRRVHLPTYPFARERYWYREGPAEPLASRGARAEFRLHPLLHRNTSDLCEQRFTSRFSGDESFLKDHRVAGARVLPAAASLEMARAAVELAGDCLREPGSVVRLCDVVWSQPFVLTGEAVDAHLRLDVAGDARPEVHFELFSAEVGTGAEERRYVSGRAVFEPPTDAPALEVSRLRGAMTRGLLTAEAFYPRWREAGIDYGPAHQGVRELHLGTGEVLARLSRPSDAHASDVAGCVLHPGLIDSALQAALGLELGADGTFAPGRSGAVSLPFALDSLELIQLCPEEVWVWIRDAGAHTPADGVRRLDLDLCDASGAPCVRMRGLLLRPLEAQEPSVEVPGLLLAHPEWREAVASAPSAAPGSQRVMVCALPYVEPEALAQALEASCVAWPLDGEDEASRFMAFAERAFEALRECAAEPASARGARIQFVIPDTEEAGMLVGIAGLLRSARLESPGLQGQVIRVDPGETAASLAPKLRQCGAVAGEVLRFEAGAPWTQGWREFAGAEGASAPWREDGVYLITGGLGGLGVLFAREILEKTRDARVVLVGRSPPREERLTELRAFAKRHDRVEYRIADVTSREQVSALVQEVVDCHGALHGVLHAAGVVSDRLLVRKTREEFRAVLAPKVAGACHLDAATQALALDFFVLFSSLAGVLGNTGQSDYATGNAFLDAFAARRDARVQAGTRQGRTCAIAWPLWDAGGMGQDAASRAAASEILRPLSTAAGLASLSQTLASGHAQVLAIHGGPEGLGALRTAAPDPEQASPPAMAGDGPSGAPADLEARLRTHVGQLLAEALKLPVHRIQPDTSFGEYGLESVEAVSLTKQLEKSFGPLSKALFFEHETLAELVAFLAGAHPERLKELFAPPETPRVAPAPEPVRLPAPAERTRRTAHAPSPRMGHAGARVETPAPGGRDIAVVGLSGRYPQAQDLDAFWEVLREGRDCIREVPPERWDWRRFYSEDRAAGATHASRWGGFLSDVDAFDADFFGLSPNEARDMDPQERLFLEQVWAAMEDAGLTRAALGGPERLVGVYAAVMYGEYQLFGADEGLRGRPGALVGSLASIANRVSHVFDLRGPSMTLETMCSSSLTAIHLACQELRQGNIPLAIAGGVNLSLHPNKYSMLSASRLLSTGARCESFGEGGDGYVPGEGVGVVLLKRLEDAERDGDAIHGVIRGSAINHGGRAHAYFAPSPNAQRLVVERALRDARLPASAVGYVEAHGTGTRLGDAVELSALTQAFRASAQLEPEACLIGSVKSNIGHGEAAAGMAALTKVLLQLRHGKVVPTLHAGTPNPNIDFAKTPFRVSQALQDWPRRPQPDGLPAARVAGISAFGAGGSNAHVVVAEHLGRAARRSTPAGPFLVPLSARTPAGLHARAKDLLAFIQAGLKPGGMEPPDLAGIAFTLQVGREAMEQRLGLLVSSLQELAASLTGYLEGAAGGGVRFVGRATGDETLAALTADEDILGAIDRWIAKGKFAPLLQLWAQGAAFDWRRLYAAGTPERVHLPTYPFERGRHWRDPDGAPTRSEALRTPVPRALEGGRGAFTPDGASGLQEEVASLILACLRKAVPGTSATLQAGTEFASLRLDSLGIAGFVGLWSAVAGKVFPAALFYEARTPRDLADLLVTRALVTEADVAAARSRAAPRREGREDGFGLSEMQQAFVVGRKLKTCGQFISSTLYLELEVREPLAPATVEQAWTQLVRHHDALRLRIDGDYRQSVSPEAQEPRLTVHDLSRLEGDALRGALAQRKERMAFQEFDLERWPYFDLQMTRLAGDHAVLHLALDEVVADGFSALLLARQLFELCTAPGTRLPPLRYSYREFVEQLRDLREGPTHAAGLAYWTRKLTPLPRAPRLAHDADGSWGARVHCLEGSLSARQWDALKARAQALRCYPSAVLLTLFGDALAEQVGPRELRLGVTKLHRPPLHEDVSQLVGLFITSNVFLHRVEADEAFEQRLLRTQKQLEDDAPHSHVDATPVLRSLRTGAEEGGELPVIFTSLIHPVFQGVPSASAWRIRDVMNTTPSVHLDHQTFEEGGVLHYRWYVPAAVFAKGDVQAVFRAYQTRLEQHARALVAPGLPAHPGTGADSATFPLTNVQTAYAFGRIASAGGDASCALLLEYEVQGVEAGRLEQAWNALVRHHPMLRCSVLSSGEQRILDGAAVAPYRIQNACAADTREAFEEGCQRVRAQLLSHHYPLDGAPFFTVRTCTLENATTRIFLHLDLLIADARSAMLIAGQLLQACEAPRFTLPTLRGTFREHVLARQQARMSPEAAEDRAAWEERFRHLPSGPRLEGAGGSGKHTLVRRVPHLQGLQARARRANVDLETVLLAAYGQTLRAWNGGGACSVVVVGWDREPLVPDTDALVGDFTRLGWVAFDDGDADVDALLQRTHAQLEADARRRHVEGLEVLRTRQGLSFPAVFTRMTPGPVPAHAISQTPGVVVDNIWRPDGDTGVVIHWDSIAADRESEGVMFDRYCDTLRAWADVAGRPEAPRLPERGPCLHTLFERAVQAHGERCAVRFGEESLTYSALEERTRQCARWLLEQGTRPGDVVAVYMDRSLEMVIALMGILRAGAAYLPLDVSAPAARVLRILSDSKARCLLTQRRFQPVWEGARRLAVCCLDGAPLPDAGPSSRDGLGTAGEGDLAYVIYTSGSTGMPKGCMVEHHSIVNRIAWMQEQFPLWPGDAVLQKTPYSFDVSVWEFFWPLAVGATLVVAKPGGHLDAAYLVDLIPREHIRVCHFVPSMLRLVLAEPDLERMAGLRHVFVSGEALEYDLLEQYRARLSVPLENLYGPTEAAVDVSYWPCLPNPERRTRIGRAITRVQLHVLNEALEPVAPGETGELYIGGVAVGRGYLGNPELTARSFVPSPFADGARLYRTGDLAAWTADGELLYLGRRDGQVKLNGLRVELAEIEHHLRRHPTVEDALVAMEGPPGRELLVAYVVPRDAASKVDRESLRGFLKECVPAYMVPHAWVRLEALPLTGHGKRRRGAARSGGGAEGRALIELLRELP